MAKRRVVPKRTPRRKRCRSGALRRGILASTLGLALPLSGCSLASDLYSSIRYVGIAMNDASHRAVHYVSATPRVVVVDSLSQAEVLEILVSQAQRLGYGVDDYGFRPASFEVRARFGRGGAEALTPKDTTSARTGNVFRIQVEADGSFVLRAAGTNVIRGGEKMHRELRWELDRLAESLAGTVRLEEALAISLEAEIAPVGSGLPLEPDLTI